MPTYVSLLNFTDQGIRTVRDTLPRGPLKCAEAWGEYDQVYWTVGPYDVVLVIEAPDEQSPPPSY
jgi:uncharacterized protein with GYD domain